MADINLGVGGANSAVAGGYDIANSVKFEPDNSEFMHFTSSQTGSDLYRMAFSVWLKRTELGTTQTIMLFGNGGSTSTRLDITFDTSDRLQVAGISTTYRLTTQVFRDTSAWYHLFFQFDTTQTTANDRMKIWVNGNLIDVADFTTVNNPAQDAVLGFNRNYKNVLGARQLIDNSISQLFAGYIAQVYSSGGTPPSVTDFGEFDTDTGIWKPIDISGISPPDSVNGFFLDFTDSSDLGNDASGNSNNFTLNNITSADQATDTPTNNFATLNPLLNLNSTLTYRDGATEAASSAINSLAEGTIGFTNGKWYYEIVMPSASPNPSANMMIGFGRNGYWGYGETDPGMDTYSFAYNRTGVVFYNGTTTSGWSAYSKGDVVMVAIDTTNGFAYFGVNGTWGNGGVPTSGSSGTGAFNYDSLVTNVSIGDLLIPAFSTGNAGNIIQLNFGGYTEVSIASGNTDENGYGTFEYAPPSGYYALCTKNLAEYG